MLGLLGAGPGRPLAVAAAAGLCAVVALWLGRGCSGAAQGPVANTKVNDVPTEPEPEPQPELPTKRVVPQNGARLRSVQNMGKLTSDAVASGPLAEIVAERGRERREKLNLPATATDYECAIEQKRWMRRSALGIARTATDYECTQEERRRVEAFEKALTPRQLIAFAGTPTEQEKLRIALRSCC
jgi:hypothetical protein